MDHGHKLNTAIVGFGRIANTIAEDQKMARYFPLASHSQVIEAHPGFERVAVVDPAHKWTEKLGEFDADFAVLAIPPEGRLEAVRQIPSLKAVLVEKPMGDEFLLNYCEKHDIAVHVNFWRRGDAGFRALADSLEEFVGKPQAVFCTYGNGLYNNGSHLVDFLRMLLGEVTEVKRTTDPVKLGVMGCSYPNVQDDYHVGFNLTIGDIPVSVLPLDFEHYREVGVDIWGTKARLTLYNEGLAINYYARTAHRGMERQHEISDQPFSLPTSQEKALYNIYDGIFTGESLSTGRSALETHRVLDEVIHG